MGHGSRWSVALAVMIVGLAALPATSTARAPGRTSAQLRRLSLDLSRLSGRIDGRARRRSLLATSRSASRAFRRRRLCVALRKVDSLKQPLSLGSTYRRGRVPRRAVRRLRRHIDRIDRPLRSRAGRRCSRRCAGRGQGASQHPGVVPPPQPPARNGEEEGEEATERLAPGGAFAHSATPAPRSRWKTLRSRWRRAGRPGRPASAIRFASS